MIHDCLSLFLVDHCVFPCWCKIFVSIWNICPFRSPPPPPWLKTNHLGVDLKRPPTKWRGAPRRSGPPTKWPWIAADGPAGKLTGGAKKHHQAAWKWATRGKKLSSVLVITPRQIPYEPPSLINKLNHICRKLKLTPREKNCCLEKQYWKKKCCVSGNTMALGL